MILKKNITRFAAGVVALCILAGPAQALVFTDPVNLVQNAMSARAAVQNEINTARTLFQQVNAAKDLAKSTNSLKNVTSLAGADKARQLYSALVDIDSRLGSNLDANVRMADDVRAQYGASNMSWEQFAASRSKMDASLRQINKDRYNAVAQSMEETSHRRQEIVSQLSAVQGQTEAMQTLGAALDVIIGQNQQIIAAMMANNKVQDGKEQIDDAQEQRVKNQRELYQQRLREAANKY